MANQYSNKYTEQDYIKKCNELNLIYVGYHKEKKLGTVIDFICKKHKDKGVQSKDWSHFRNYTYGCPYCSGRYKTNKEIYKEMNNENIELLTEYKGSEKPITCRCKICGYIWTTIPKVLTTNKSGCPKCGREKATKAETKTREQFILEMSKIDNSIEIIGDYVNTHTKIKCRCKRCGRIWFAYPANLLNKSAGCPGCNASIGEKLMLDILTSLGIDYVPQYPIKDGIHKKPLRFDAFDKNNNIAYEFNGEQHYYPVDFAGKGEEWANEQFKITKERDSSKLKYCKKNNIDIVIIPYWEKDNMEHIIKNNIKEKNKNIA